MIRNAPVVAMVLVAFILVSRVSAQERIATNDTYNEFPRWTMLVNAFNVKDGGGGRVLPGSVSLAQDVKNVLHVSGTLAVSGGGNQVFHVHNGLHSRRGNGYSEPYQISSLSSGQSATDVETAALSDGRVIVFWVQPGASGNDIRWRERSAAGVWGSVQSGLTGASGDVLTNLRATLRGTAIHMVYVRTNGASVKLEYVNPTTSWTPTVVSDSAATSAAAAGANVAVDGSGNLFFVYEDLPNGGGMYGRFRTKPSGGGVSNSTDIAQDAYSPDVAVDSSGNAHIVYVKGSGANSGKVYHLVGIGGSHTHVGNTTASTAAFDRARIVLDTRDRPNVMWSTNGDVGYAVKVGSTWTRQEPVLEPGRGNTGSGRGTNSWSFGPLDVVINPFDVVSCIETTGGLLLSMHEPNLGVPESNAVFPMGPNATANGTTGNLFFNLPLFRSKGVGFAVRFALSYNSLESDWGSMSAGWNHNYNMFVVDGATGTGNNQDTITLAYWQGHRAVYRYSSSLGYHVADGEFGDFSKLERVTDSSSTNWVHSKYKLTTKFGIKYHFRSDGKVEKCEDTNSNDLLFHYAGDSGYAADSTHPAGALVELEDSLRNLSGAQAGRKTKLTYNSDKQLATIQDPKATGPNYAISYDANMRLSGVTFSGATGVVWTFTYHTTNNSSQGKRAGLFDQVRTPRGTAAGTPYGYSYKWYDDNRFASVTDPQVTVITSCTTDASPVSDSPVHGLEYTDPTSTFSTPNAGAPGTNTVPVVSHVDPCGRTTDIEYQYRRALADNITDPLAKSVIFTHDSTTRNLTKVKDKRGYEANYIFHTTATPSHVKDNLWKIERPTSSGSGFLSPITLTYTTDSLNRTASVTDAMGRTTTFTYDSAGNKTLVSFPTVTLITGGSQSASQSYTYTTRGRPATYTTTEGSVWTFEYGDETGTGLFTKVRTHGQSSADARTSEHDILGNLKKVTASPGNQTGGVTEYVLDGLYRRVTEIDPLSNETHTAYDADSNVIEIENRRGNSTTFAYDARNSLTSRVQPSGTSTYTYDRESRLRRFTNNRGYTVRLLYDELGRIKELKIPGAGTVGGGGPTDHVTQLAYDENGNRISLTSVGSTNRVFSYSYDARNNLKLITYPVGSLKDEFLSDDNDSLLAINRFDNTTFLSGSYWGYDERHRITKKVLLDAVYSGGSPSGPATLILRDKDGKIKKIWNPNGSTSSSAYSIEHVYDFRRRLSQVKDSAGVVVRQYGYYEDDAVMEVKGQKPIIGGLITVAEYEYSKRGEITKFIDALSKEWTRAFDENGNLASTTDPLGKTVSFAYDTSDRLTTLTRYATTLNIVTSYTYDENSNLKTLTVFNPATGSNNAVYSFDYDKSDRKEKVTNPNTSHTRLWTYNDHGEMATYTDPNGKVQTNSYDNLGRITSEAHGSPYSVTITRQYRGASRLVKQIADGTTTIDNTFNSLERLTQSAWTVGGSAFKSISYGYDAAGNRTSMTDPEGVSFVYTYDNDNRLSTVQRGGSTYGTYTYDAGGRIKDLTLLNGSKVEWLYSDRNEIAQVKTTTSGAVVRADFQYSYNDRGNLTQLVRAHLGETITYTVDDASRLTGESSTGSSGTPPITVPARTLTWTYNKAHGRTSETAGGVTRNFSYNSENRLTTETLANGDQYAYTYDSAGNRTQRAFTPNGGSTPTVTETMSYDYGYRLSSYVKVAGTTTVTSYAYMATADGQRLQRNNVLSSTVDWYMYDGGEVVTDYTKVGTGSLTHTKSYVDGLGGKVAQVIASSGAKEYYVPDGLGSVTHILDSTQALAYSEATDAWGNLVASGGSATSRYGFNQLQTGSESGLFFGGDSYDPRVGTLANVTNEPWEDTGAFAPGTTGVIGFFPTGVTGPEPPWHPWGEPPKPPEEEPPDEEDPEEDCEEARRAHDAAKGDPVGAIMGTVAGAGVGPGGPGSNGSNKNSPRGASSGGGSGEDDCEEEDNDKDEKDKICDKKDESDGISEESNWGDVSSWKFHPPKGTEAYERWSYANSKWIIPKGGGVPLEEAREASKTAVIGTLALITAPVAAKAVIGLGFKVGAGTAVATGSGTIVLGRYPNYIQKAKDIGAQCLNVSKDKWTGTMNKDFLNWGIETNKRFVLSDHWATAPSGSNFQKEILYMLSKGYTPSKSGMELIGPK